MQPAGGIFPLFQNPQICHGGKTFADKNFIAFRNRNLLIESTGIQKKLIEPILLHTGRRYVREWDYLSGKTRGWHDTLDHFGNVRQVRPDTSITGGQKVHYCFNKQGKYTGKW